MELTNTQHSIKFRAFLYDGELKYIDGNSPEHFSALPNFPTLLLGVRLEFSDGTARLVSGQRWIYLISDRGTWTIDDDGDANSILTKYPNAIIKQGGTVVEQIMQEVNTRIMEPIV